MLTKRTIGQQIRKYRNEAGLTLEEVGERVGRSRRTISAWEQGRSEPNAQMLIKLCEILGVDISDFYITDDFHQIQTSSEDELVVGFRKLNDDGQARALEYINVLNASGMYSRDKGGSADTEVLAS